MQSEPDSMIGTDTIPTGRIAGNIYRGKFGEDEMLAAPDIEDRELQQRIMRRGRRVMLCVLLSVLLLCAATFYVFGVLVSGNRETMCGVVGHLASPACTRVSWEFVVGASALGIVLLVTLGLTASVLFQMPASARRRRKLREQRRRYNAAAEEP